MKKRSLVLLGIFLATSVIAGEKTYTCSDDMVEIKADVDSETAKGSLGGIEFNADFVEETDADETTLRTYTDKTAGVTVVRRVSNGSVNLDCHYPDGGEWMVPCKVKK